MDFQQLMQMATQGQIPESFRGNGAPMSQMPPNPGMMGGMQAPSSAWEPQGGQQISPIDLLLMLLLSPPPRTMMGAQGNPGMIQNYYESPDKTGFVPQEGMQMAEDGTFVPPSFNQGPPPMPARKSRSLMGW